MKKREKNNGKQERGDTLYVCSKINLLKCAMTIRQYFCFFALLLGTPLQCDVIIALASIVLSSSSQSLSRWLGVQKKGAEKMGLAQSECEILKQSRRSTTDFVCDTLVLVVI